MEALPSAEAIRTEFSLFAAGEAHPFSYENGSPVCACARCSKWHRFLKVGNAGQPYFLVPTLELIEGLAEWLSSEAQRVGGQLFRVLEVGCGDGALAGHLRSHLAQVSSGEGTPVQLIATDSGARGLRSASGSEVEQCDAIKAMCRYEPHAVLCSFMPLGVDWTAAMRATASVRAYILLGEADDGCCGQPWATWGYVCEGDEEAEQGLGDVSSTSSSSADADADFDSQLAGDDDDKRPSIDSHVGCTAESVWRNQSMEASEMRGLCRAGSYEEAPEAWRRVWEYEPHRTVWGSEGWSRLELAAELPAPVQASFQSSLIGCTDVCWSSRHHTQAVLFRRTKPSANR